MLQPETPTTYPGLLEACRAHIAKIQRWRRGNNVYTFLGIEGSYTFDWTLQLISSDDSRLVLDIALSRPDHIEAFRKMQTFSRWQVCKDDPADFQATLNMPSEAERCEKYIAVLLHKILGVTYGTPLLAELSETLPPPEENPEGNAPEPQKQTVVAPSPTQENAAETHTLAQGNTDEAQVPSCSSEPMPHAESPTEPTAKPAEVAPEPIQQITSLPQEEIATAPSAPSTSVLTPEPASISPLQTVATPPPGNAARPTIYKVQPKSSSLPIVLGIIIGVIMLFFGIIIIAAMISEL